MERLARLRPVFREGGTVTAGNSSGINDAVALLLMSAGKASELGLKPMAPVTKYSIIQAQARGALRSVAAAPGMQIEYVGQLSLLECEVVRCPISVEP